MQKGKKTKSKHRIHTVEHGHDSKEIKEEFDIITIEDGHGDLGIDVP